MSFRMMKSPEFRQLKPPGEDLLPDRDHGTMKRDYEYKRLGTLSLLAGIDLQTSEAIHLVSNTHNSRDYIAFLEKLNATYPLGDKIRLVLDNLKVHSSAEVQKYISTIPDRFEFVFTPKHASWLNLVEGFFSKMTKQMLKNIQVKSKEEYDNWRCHYPKFDTTQRWAKVPSQELSDALVEMFKDQLKPDK